MSPSKSAAKVVPLPTARPNCAFCSHPAVFSVTVEDTKDLERSCGTHLSTAVRLLMQRHDAAVTVQLAKGATL